MRDYFQKCCKELQIDYDTLFYLGVSRSKKGDRLTYRVSTPKIPRPLFAVCYFYSMNVFAVWKTEIYDRTSFNVDKSEADKVIPNQIKMAKKHMNKRNGEPEVVYIFNADSLNLFLETYVLPLIKKF